MKRRLADGSTPSFYNFGGKKSVHPDLNPSSPVPLYYQLEQILQQYIEAGALAPGTRLASEEALERQYGLSRITVRKALANLVATGYVTRGRGKGTFVAQPKLQDDLFDKLSGWLDRLRQQGHKIAFQVIQIREIPAPPKARRVLALPENRKVIAIQRVLHVDDEPICLISGFLAHEEGMHVLKEDLEPYVSLLPFMEEKCGLRLVHADKTIEATLATEGEVRILRVKRGSPILLDDILLYTEDGTPRLFVRSAYRGDRYTYHISLHR